MLIETRCIFGLKNVPKQFMHEQIAQLCVEKCIHLCNIRELALLDEPAVDGALGNENDHNACIKHMQFFQ